MEFAELFYPDGGMIDAQDAIRRARSLLVITGAGISAESGIPTFRDRGGWWKTYKPEEFATRKAFEQDPAELWRWYDARRAIVARAQPNPAHRALARAEAKGRRVSIVTQNVDDLHERAGSRDVVHVHGNIWRMRCTVEHTVFEDRRVPLPEIPPRCASGHLARPDVVWWDEDLDPLIVEHVEQILTQPFDIALVIGTDATFDYIREWALRTQRRGVPLVEVNPRSTALSALADARLAAPAGEALDGLFA